MPVDCPDGAFWVAAEFRGAPLGNARLGARLVTVAGLLGTDPMASLLAVAKENRQRVKGYCGVIDLPDDSAAIPQSILQPHSRRTLRRIRGEAGGSVHHDSTDPNFVTWPGCEGLRVIGTNQTRAESRGWQQRSKLAVAPEGLPLAKDEPRTPADRKSVRWIEGFRDCVELVRDLGLAKDQ